MHKFQFLWSGGEFSDFDILGNSSFYYEYLKFKALSNFGVKHDCETIRQQETVASKRDHHVIQYFE